MRNWKMFSIVSGALMVTATVAALAYAPVGPGPVSGPASLAAAPYAAKASYAPWHKDALHKRVAQSCIAHGQTCTINGTPCCNSADACKGTFPNTYCQ